MFWISKFEKPCNLCNLCNLFVYQQTKLVIICNFL